jgi:hypothetical protein
MADLVNGDCWYHDASAQVLHVRSARAATGTAVVAHYDVAARSTRQVQIELTVELPASTPGSDVIYFASSLDGWVSNARPLTRVSPTLATLTLTVPENQSWQYKFTRGDWTTVEKDAACNELPNRERIALGDHDGRQYLVDTVASWVDLCN